MTIPLDELEARLRQIAMAPGVPSYTEEPLNAAVDAIAALRRQLKALYRLPAELVDMRRERDEAERRYEVRKALHENEHAETRAEVERLTRERDEARAERDEARNELKRMFLSWRTYEKAVQRAEAAEVERDEALAERDVARMGADGTLKELLAEQDKVARLTRLRDEAEAELADMRESMQS